ncbi:MAG TPA: SDR family oxidoreductase [Planctomycetaceae bacterium]|nr:SDR family oxidoreductase [Planctomycetaceae bacterium]
MRVIRGKRALVTGAASGIGRALALALAREGAHVYLLDVDDARLSAVAAEAARQGVDAVAARCDLTRPADITAALQEMLDRWGGVDIVVNNAGVVYYGPTDRMTAAQWDWLLGINLLAPIQIIRELLPVLKERPEAHILNVCSIAGLVAGGRTAAYHVAKFGLVGFSEALRAEYARRGIGVTALCPGPVRTNLYRSGISGKGPAVPLPPRWICASEEAVARKAIRAIRRNRRLVLVTPLAHLLFNVKRFAPWVLDVMNRFSLRRRKRPAGEGEAPGSPESGQRPAGGSRRREAA